MNRKCKVWIVGGFFILMSCLFLFASDNVVSPEKQTDILLKVLGYDRSLLNRGGKSLRIGVIYTDLNPESVGAWQKINTSLDHITSGGCTVGGKKLSYSGILYTSEEDLKRFASMVRVAVFFVTPGNESNLASITRVAQSEGILTFSGVIHYMVRGIATGVELIDGNPKIVIHLSSAKAQGADFKADLLKIAKVIQ
jgi:hypothetical protein